MTEGCTQIASIRSKSHNQNHQCATSSRNCACKHTQGQSQCGLAIQWDYIQSTYEMSAYVCRFSWPYWKIVFGGRWNIMQGAEPHALYSTANPLYSQQIILHSVRLPTSVAHSHVLKAAWLSSQLAHLQLWAYSLQKQVLRLKLSTVGHEMHRSSTFTIINYINMWWAFSGANVFWTTLRWSTWRPSVAALETRT